MQHWGDHRAVLKSQTCRDSRPRLPSQRRLARIVTEAMAFPLQRDFFQQREAMVRTQLADRGIHDERVLAAMQKVPRHEFVQDAFRKDAYEDHPLPIGEGQTISQPYIVAAMLQYLALQPADRVLEVGTGSGYVTTLLSLLCAEVY